MYLPHETAMELFRAWKTAGRRWSEVEAYLNLDPDITHDLYLLDAHLDQKLDTPKETVP